MHRRDWQRAITAVPARRLRGHPGLSRPSISVHPAYRHTNLTTLPHHLPIHSQKSARLHSPVETNMENLNAILEIPIPRRKSTVKVTMLMITAPEDIKK